MTLTTTESLPPPDALVDLDGIDLAAGRAALMGNEKLYRRLLLMFLRKHSAFETRLQAALDRGDLDAAMREAHDLGGLSASLGMQALSPCCKQLELAFLQQADRPELDALIAPLVRELQVVLRSLAGAETALS